MLIEQALQQIMLQQPGVKILQSKADGLCNKTSAKEMKHKPCCNKRRNEHQTAGCSAVQYGHMSECFFHRNQTIPQLHLHCHIH